MKEYKIEGGFNFYDELFKSMDEDMPSEENLCQITGTPLVDRFVKLECNHRFNYNALYKEIYRQKFEFRTYNTCYLLPNDSKKVRDSKLDYFIRCPYCRNIQFTILPYYEDSGLEQKYGINTLDRNFLHKDEYCNGNVQSNYDHSNYSFYKYGVQFKKGTCAHICSKSLIACSSQKSFQYVAKIPHSYSDLTYCTIHYKQQVKLLKEEKKLKAKEEKKLKAKEEKMNAVKEKALEKEKLLEEKTKLLEEKNTERLAKGLPLLKRLPVKRKIDIGIQSKSVHLTNENTVIQTATIGQYVPDDAPIESETNTTNSGCINILKTGPNKGNMCGCKIFESSLCKRHYKK
jgi:hypothetical protein